MLDLNEFEKLGFKKQTEIKYKGITVLLPEDEKFINGYCVITPLINYYLVNKDDALRICENVIKKIERQEKQNEQEEDWA